MPPPKSSARLRASARSGSEHGLGVHGVEVARDEPATPQELRQTLLEIFQRPDYRPPVLPSVAIELTALTRKASASYDDVVAVLQKDPLFVAGVLKVAQSPVYAGRIPLQSLKEAVQRLGINTLRDIVWQVVAGVRLFRVKGYTAIMERLQAHSMFMACAARLIATRAGVAAEHAFLCGLLHDVGISGTLIAIAESEKQAPELSTLLAAIDGMHEEAGAMMAKLWRLSPEIVAVVEQHHQFDPNRKGIPVLTAVLCVAERLADDLGYGIVDASTTWAAGQSFDCHAPGHYELALKRLRLDGKEEDLNKRARELVEQLAASA